LDKKSKKKYRVFKNKALDDTKEKKTERQEDSGIMLFHYFDIA